MPTILQRPSPNKSGTLVPRYIMLHHTAGTSFEGAVAYMRRLTSMVSAHYVVGKRGEIAQLVPLNKKAWHAGKGGPYKTIPLNQGNAYCIGIEIVNLGDGKDPFPEAQLKALDWLINEIDHLVGRELPIIDHKAYAFGRKVDMRPNFPLANYQKYRRYQAPPPKTSAFTLRRVLKIGSTGSDVLQLQRALTSRGFRTTPDGDFGPATAYSVKRFQRARNLTADGIVGRNTALALGWKWA